jgi:hypothetical protein
MSHRWRWIAIAEYAGAALLGAIVLSAVAQKADTRTYETVVHVMEVGVDVWIDGTAYRVDDPLDSPVVCELGPGRHTLRMARNGRILYEEDFTIDTDRDTVLTAWDAARLNGARSTAARTGAIPPWSEPRAETVGSFDVSFSRDACDVCREGAAAPISPSRSRSVMPAPLRDRGGSLQ